MIAFFLRIRPVLNGWVAGMAFYAALVVGSPLTLCIALAFFSLGILTSPPPSK